MRNGASRCSILRRIGQVASFSCSTSTLEQIQASPRKRTIYVCVILTLLATILVIKTFRFIEGGFWYGSQTVDFAAFHIVAQRIWLGDLDLTYQFSSFLKMQLRGGRRPGSTPCPGPTRRNSTCFSHRSHSCRAGPLFCLHGGHARSLSDGASCRCGKRFCAGARRRLPGDRDRDSLRPERLARREALIGLICINAERRPVLAGLALGVMVIKPHSAIAAARHAADAPLADGPDRRGRWWSRARLSARSPSVRRSGSPGWQHPGSRRLSGGRAGTSCLGMISAYAALYNAGVPLPGRSRGRW